MRLPPLSFDLAHAERRELIQSVKAATGAELLLQRQLAFQESKANQLEKGVRNALTLLYAGHSSAVRRVLERALIF